VVNPGSSCQIELTVVRWSAATYLEDQDHWYHAGLHRSVFLYVTPRVHILDVHAVADWEPSTGDGRVGVDVVVGGPATTGAVARLFLDGVLIGQTEARWEHPRDIDVNAYAFDGRGARVTTTVPRVAPWSAEHPRLHDLRVELARDDDLLDSVSLRVGFRRVEIRGHELLVNGRAVLIKGVNRHDHDPLTGKTVSRSSIRHDIELMKAHNLNAVRTSHYPNDVYLYDVCDELGMYVVDEANVETHAYQRSLTRSAEWAPAILERIARMAQRDKNTPRWSCGRSATRADGRRSSMLRRRGFAAMTPPGLSTTRTAITTVCCAASRRGVVARSST
jgi:beta-galactosidase